MLYAVIVNIQGRCKAGGYYNDQLEEHADGHGRDSDKDVAINELILAVKGRLQCCNRDYDNNQEEDVDEFMDNYDRYPGRRLVNDKHADKATQPLLNSVRNAELQ